MGEELSRRQAQNGVNFDFEVKFDLEGQGQSPPKTIGILTKVFYTYAPNLVILAWTGDELSRGQTWWRTDGLTDGRTQATTIPEGQYWPRVIRIMVKNVDPNYDAYRRQKSSIKSCFGHKYVYVCEVRCQIVALKSSFCLLLRRPRLEMKR